MLAKGTSFSIHDGDEFLIIPDVQTFTPGSPVWDTVEITPLETTSKARTFATTIHEVSDFTFTTLYKADDPAQDELKTAHASGNAAQFRFTVPNNTLGSFTLTGIVTACKPVTDVDGIFAYDVAVKVTGALADDAATLAAVTVTDAQAGAYVTGEAITLRGTWDEYVYVTGTPRISITLDSGTVHANYTSGSGTNQLNFSYTFQGGDQAEATEVAIVSPIGLNGGSILDRAGNAATLTFTPPNTSAWTVNPA